MSRIDNRSEKQIDKIYIFTYQNLVLVVWGYQVEMKAVPLKVDMKRLKSSQFK